MKHKPLNEQETKVAEYLAAEGFTVSVKYIGADTEADSWERDEWRVRITNSANITETFEYYTGTGHRVMTAMAALDDRRNWNKNCIGYHEWKKTAYEPQIPPVAGLLYCTISSMSALEQPFMSWANEYGYSDDSIKAYKIYEACQKEAFKLKHLFAGTQLAKLQELLEDY